VLPRSKVDLLKGEYFIEFKKGKSFDPFVDNNDDPSLRDEDYPFEADADLSMITRGQILTYCTAISRSQFRTHVFGVSILSSYARLFPWDPSGSLRYGRDQLFRLYQTSRQLFGSIHLVLR